MKKVLPVVLVMMLVVSLAACNVGDTAKKTAGGGSPSDTYAIDDAPFTMTFSGSNVTVTVNYGEIDMIKEMGVDISGELVIKGTYSADGEDINFVFDEAAFKKSVREMAEYLLTEMFTAYGMPELLESEEFQGYIDEAAEQYGIGDFVGTAATYDSGKDEVDMNGLIFKKK